MDKNIVSEVQGRAGLITLNRAKALNALSLAMIRSITASLLAWRDDRQVQVVGIRGMRKSSVAGAADEAFGAFCAGGDIRFFHQAALAGNPELEDFFTEEYRLNHLIHNYPKPVVAFMDGIVMGGGMAWPRAPAHALPPNAPRWPCPRPTSACFPTWAAVIS